MEVERAGNLLTSPSAETLERCASILESACSDLASSRNWPRAARGNPEALTEVRRLEEAVRRAAHLLQIAQDYFAKWSQTCAALTSGYTPNGGVPSPLRRGLVSLTG